MRPIVEKFKAATEKLSSEELITITKGTRIRLRGSAAVDELTVSEINSRGPWAQILWDNLSNELLSYWWIIRFADHKSKFPNNAHTVRLSLGTTSQLVYTDANGKEYFEEITGLKRTCMSGWKSKWQSGLPQTTDGKSPHLEALEKKDYASFVQLLREGKYFEIGLEPPSASGYDKNLFNLENIQDRTLELAIAAARVAGYSNFANTCTDLVRMDEFGIFDPKKKFTKIQLYRDGSIRLITSGSEGVSYHGFNEHYFVDSTESGKLSRFINLATVRDGAKLSEIIPLLTDREICTDPSAYSDPKTQILSGDLNHLSWGEELWEEVRSSEFASILEFVRWGTRYGCKTVRLQSGGALALLEGPRKLRIRTNTFKHYRHRLAEIFEATPTNVGEAFLILDSLPITRSSPIGTVERDAINAAAQMLDGVTVVLSGNSTDANISKKEITWEALTELFGRGSLSHDALTCDKIPAPIANGDQITDITYYIENRLYVWKENVRSITFNFSKKQVVFTSLDGKTKTVTQEGFRDTFKVQFPENSAPQTPNTQPQTQKKEEPQMASNTDQTIVNLLNKARKDGRRMAVRTASRELVLTVRDPIAAALANALGPGDPDVQRKVALLMAGPLGKAIVGAAASAGLAAINGRFITKSNHMEIAEEVADELKIEAGAEVMGIFTGAVMGPVRELMVGTINSIAAGEEPQIPPPSEQPSAGLGAGSNDVIDTHAEEMVAEKVEVKKS